MADNVIVRVPEQQFIKGEDGYSPEVTIEDIAHGHSVIITDRDHPEGQSFNVLDGDSAYEQAVAGGYEGTEAQFNAELGSFGELSEQAASSATTATTRAEQAKLAYHRAEDAQVAAEAAAAQALTRMNSADASAQAAATTATTFTEQTVPAAVNTINEAKADALTAVGNAQTTAVGAVQTESTTQQSAIQQKGAETLASIPEDYTDLSEDVSDLKSALSDFTISPDNINKWNPAEAVANTTLSQAQATLGNLVNLSGYTTSGFIAVKNNDVVRWDYLTNAASPGAFMGRGATVYRIGEFDSDKNCLLVTENWADLPYTVQNANTAFIRICVVTKGTNSVMIGNTSTAQTYYIPYRDLDVNAAYPFEPDDYPIKEIVFERYVSNKLAVIEISRNFNSNGTYVYAILFFDFITNTNLYIFNVAASSYTEESRVDFNLSSGYKGHLIIDWSAIPDGGQIRNTWQISQAAFAFANTLSTYQYPLVYPYTKLSDCPIYDIRFTEYDPTKTYYIDGIGRKVNSTPVHYVRLRDSDNNTYLLLNILSSNYTEKAENSFSKGSYGNAGLSGTFWIDWSKIPEGTQPNFGKPQLSPLCMALSAVNRNTLGNDIKVVVPSTIYGVVGHPFSLYYYNIFMKDSLDDYHFTITNASANAENMGNRIRFSCASAGTTSHGIRMRKDTDETIVSKTISVQVLAENIPAIKAIFIGDSFVDGGKMQAELKHLMGDKLTFYGTRSSNTKDSTGTTQTILDEGRSSWSWDNYLTLASKNGVTNAFWDGSKFDFSYYMTQNPSFSDVTDVFLLSGPNDFGAHLTQYITRYQAIVDSIKTYSNSIRIHCMMPLTCNCDGYAWGIRNYNGAQEYRKAMLDFGQGIIDTFTSDSQCSVVPTHIYFDRIYDFPHTEVAVNDRTPTLVDVFNDNVHPNEYGYFCMADMLFADIVAHCN